MLGGTKVFPLIGGNDWGMGPGIGPCCGPGTGSGGVGPIGGGGPPWKGGGRCILGSGASGGPFTDASISWWRLLTRATASAAWARAAAFAAAVSGDTPRTPYGSLGYSIGAFEEPSLVRFPPMAASIRGIWPASLFKRPNCAGRHMNQALTGDSRILVDQTNQGLTPKHIFRKHTATLEDSLDEVDMVLDLLSEVYWNAVVFVLVEGVEDGSVGALITDDWGEVRDYVSKQIPGSNKMKKSVRDSAKL